MGIGQTVTSDGIEFEVVWAGGEGLIPERTTKVGDTWEPPVRMYNKSGKYAKAKLKLEELENDTDEN